jgi:hypothetical protein
LPFSPDPKLSLCNAVFLIGRRDHHVRRAFTLDRHLVDAGFDLVL